MTLLNLYINDISCHPLRFSLALFIYITSLFLSRWTFLIDCEYFKFIKIWAIYLHLSFSHSWVHFMYICILLFVQTISFCSSRSTLHLIQPVFCCCNGQTASIRPLESSFESAEQSGVNGQSQNIFWRVSSRWVTLFYEWFHSWHLITRRIHQGGKSELFVNIFLMSLKSSFSDTSAVGRERGNS